MSAYAHLPPPSRSESLAAVLARFGGSWDARGWAVLPAGRVYGSGIVLSPDGDSLVAEFAQDFGTMPGGRHWLLNHTGMRRPVWVPGCTAVAAVNLGSGYAHWLLEELPRWLALRAVGADCVIANTRAAFIREALAALNRPGRVISVSRHGHHACETLVIPPPAAPVAETLAALNAFADGLGNADLPAAEKIYISREGAARRRVRNEAELWSRLEPRGFVKLRLEERPWRGQVAAFAAAKVVVGPHGAGLANLAFCRPGTRVVEFFNRSYVNPCFGRLAEAARLDYRAVVPSGVESLGMGRRANREDIVADVGGLLAELD